jgi:hypothetical protein
MDATQERIINDWIGSTQDAIAALHGWLDSLEEWKRNNGREHSEGDFMAAFRRMVELMGDGWADDNPCDIDKLAALVKGEDVPEQKADPWQEWALGWLDE